MGKKYLRLPFAYLIIFGIALSISFTNCQVYQTPTEIEGSDLSSSERMPEEISFSPPVNLQQKIPGVDNLFSFGGNCTVADSADHYLEFTMRVERSNGDLSAPMPISNVIPCSGDQCTINSEFKCEHGRYNVYFPVPGDAVLGAKSNRNGWKLQIDGALIPCKSVGRLNCERDSLLSWSFVILAEAPPN